jgi:hypothetical protein
MEQRYPHQADRIIFKTKIKVEFMSNDSSQSKPQSVIAA